MTALRYLLLVVFCIDAFLLMGQYSANQINPGGIDFINYNGSLTSTFDTTGTCYSSNGTRCVINEDVENQIPQSSSSISPTTGNIFTDSFTTIKGWFFSLPGVNYIVGAVNVLPNWLKGFGMDPVFAYIISAIWHMYAIWLLIEFLVGRQ